LPVSPEHLLVIKDAQEKNLSLIWRKAIDPKYRIGKYFQAEFDYNVGDLWLNPKAEIKSGRKTYLFGLYYGRNPAEISEITG